MGGLMKTVHHGGKETRILHQALIPAVVLAVVCALATGRGVYRQGRSNFDTAADLAEAQAALSQVASAETRPSFPLGSELSKYNQKVINARLIRMLPEDDIDVAGNVYLSRLKSEAVHLARLPLAARRTGIAVAWFVGASSFILYFCVGWLLTASLLLAIRRRSREGDLQ
jgi:hypothetical protein